MLMMGELDGLGPLPTPNHVPRKLSCELKYLKSFEAVGFFSIKVTDCYTLFLLFGSLIKRPQSQIVH